MDKRLINEMLEVLNKIGMYEVNEKDCKNSNELLSQYDHMDERIKSAVKVKKQSEERMKELSSSIEELKKKIVSEPDESNRKKFYSDMKSMIDEKEFLELNSQYRLTPQLVKESAEMEKSEEYSKAYQKEWGKYANEGLELQKQLRDLSKKIDELIEKEKNAHPFMKVKRTAEQYRYKR